MPNPGRGTAQLVTGKSVDPAAVKSAQLLSPWILQLSSPHSYRAHGALALPRTGIDADVIGVVSGLSWHLPGKIWCDDAALGQIPTLRHIDGAFLFFTTRLQEVGRHLVTGSWPTGSRGRDTVSFRRRHRALHVAGSSEASEQMVVCHVTAIGRSGFTW